MGNRIRSFRKNLKGKTLSDGKKISGKGRLSDKLITTMQKYFCFAIRQNADNLYAMKKSVGAILYHLTENADSEERQILSKN